MKSSFVMADMGLLSFGFEVYKVGEAAHGSEARIRTWNYRVNSARLCQIELPRNKKKGRTPVKTLGHCTRTKRR